MEDTPEKSSSGIQSVVRPSFLHGKIDFYEETISDALGLLEEIQRDILGHVVYHAWYERDANGRIVRERFMSKMPKERPEEGAYVWLYDETGKYIGKDREKK